MKTKEVKKEVKKLKNSVPTFIEFIYSINLKNLTR